MISKFAFVCTAAQAIKIYGVSETCSTNIDRMGTQDSDFETYLGKGSPYVDKVFPASAGSLYWNSFPQ